MFTQQMGGVFSKPKEQVFKPHYEFSVDKDTGLSKPACTALAS
ncbi:hypothetical protein P4S64_10885 [Vibrio sp. M60_M31a]